MSFLLAGAIAVGAAGAAKAISGGVQKKKAKAAQAQAQADLDAQKQAFKNLDTSNPYANLENTMEDLTVNQEEAQFIAEQQQASQANILQDLRGAAGSSGIAGLAQTLANQGSKNARQAAVSIGKQEKENQMKERAEAGAIQKAERQGDIMSRNMERDKVDTLMRMAGQDVAAQRQAVAAADSKMWSGITSAAGSVGGIGNAMGGVGGGAGNVAKSVGQNVDPSQIDFSNIQMAPGTDPNTLGLPEGLNYSLPGDYDQQHLYTNDPNTGY